MTSATIWPDFSIVEPEEGWESADLSWLSKDDPDHPSLLRVVPFRETTSAPNARNTFSLPKDEFYGGPLAYKRPEEVAYILSEAIEYLALTSQPVPPLPYDGLRGQGELPRDEVAERIWSEAIRLLQSTALGKPRAAEAAWRHIRATLRNIRIEAVQAHVAEEMKRQTAIERPRDEDALVYFIASVAGPIKIGMAADPVKRLTALQTGHHERLSILAICDGGRVQEMAYHRKYARHRLSGEWFTRHPDILAEIARLTGETARD